jgi:hypothetical protein
MKLVRNLHVYRGHLNLEKGRRKGGWEKRNRGGRRGGGKENGGELELWWVSRGIGRSLEGKERGGRREAVGREKR